jgi:hypothetical protein
MQTPGRKNHLDLLLEPKSPLRYVMEMEVWNEDISISAADKKDSEEI